MTPGARTAIIVTSYPGQPGVAELQRQAERGNVPRKDYVELARRFGVDIIDNEYLTTRGSALAGAVARRLGTPAGQVTEALLRGRRYERLWAWSDRTGLPIALVFKIFRSKRDFVLVSAWPSRPKKAIFFRPLRAHTSIQLIISGSRAQLDHIQSRLGVPGDKLCFLPWPVDLQYWQPRRSSLDTMICAVGMEARDYGTLFRAVRGLEVDVELAVGTHVLSWGRATAQGESRRDAPFDFLRGTVGHRLYRSWTARATEEGLPPNVTVSEQLGARELRDLYARARFVVVPLHDVDSDCGITTMIEAMAMGKALIVTRSRGQVDVIQHGREGLYVPPYDAAALRSSIEHLLAHPEEAERMGRAGRALVEARHDLDAYVDRLAGFLEPPGRA